MHDPNFIILYVRDPAISAVFYSKLLQRDPVEASPNFAMFALSSGVMLGLWAEHTVQPIPQGRAGSAEIAISLDDARLVETCHDAWVECGLSIVQAPVEMDFGYTFVAVDPDGHRLRVFAPGGQ